MRSVAPTRFRAAAASVVSVGPSDFRVSANEANEPSSSIAPSDIPTIKSTTASKVDGNQANKRVPGSTGSDVVAPDGDESGGVGMGRETEEGKQRGFHEFSQQAQVKCSTKTFVHHSRFPIVADQGDSFGPSANSRPWSVYASRTSTRF